MTKKEVYELGARFRARPLFNQSDPAAITGIAFACFKDTVPAAVLALEVPNANTPPAQPLDEPVAQIAREHNDPTWVVKLYTPPGWMDGYKDPDPPMPGWIKKQEANA